MILLISSVVTMKVIGEIEINNVTAKELAQDLLIFQSVRFTISVLKHFHYDLQRRSSI